MWVVKNFSTICSRRRTGWPSRSTPRSRSRRCQKKVARSRDSSGRIFGGKFSQGVNGHGGQRGKHAAWYSETSRRGWTNTFWCSPGFGLIRKGLGCMPPNWLFLVYLLLFGRLCLCLDLNLWLRSSWMPSPQKSSNDKCLGNASLTRKNQNYLFQH